MCVCVDVHLWLWVQAGDVSGLCSSGAPAGSSRAAVAGKAIRARLPLKKTTERKTTAWTPCCLSLFHHSLSLSHFFFFFLLFLLNKNSSTSVYSSLLFHFISSSCRPPAHSPSSHSPQHSTQPLIYFLLLLTFPNRSKAFD